MSGERTTHQVEVQVVGQPGAYQVHLPRVPQRGEYVTLEAGQDGVWLVQEVCLLHATAARYRQGVDALVVVTGPVRRGPFV